MTSRRSRARVLRALPVLAVCLVFPGRTSGAFPATATDPPASERRPEWLGVDLGSMPIDVFNLALDAAACAERAGDVVAPRTLTVVDYSKPSSEKRLWVVDLGARRLMYEELVAHGEGSGGNLPTVFSNQPESHQSSLGLFVTAETYVGRNGYSLRLDGLDAGFNDRARERAIVMHGASYVSDAFVRDVGRLGRSWGCPAVRAGVARALLDEVRGGSLLFAYYPDPEWLEASGYLGACAAAAADDAPRQF